MVQISLHLWRPSGLALCWQCSGASLLAWLWLPFVLCLDLTGAPSVQINEIQAVNTTSVPAIVDFEDYPDWIELRNTAEVPVALDGYYLSDDPANPTQWAIPAGATIPAGGFLVIWADGHNAGPGGIFPRGYWPWRNFSPAEYHTSFSLASAGETLVLSRAEGIVKLDLITAAGPVPPNQGSVTRWRYFDSIDPPAADWNTLGFDDSSWAEGAAPLGYGDGDEATVLNAGPEANNHPITSYYRHSFTFSPLQQVNSMTVRLLADDGAVVYLNGTELFRQNMPAGALTASTLASATIGEAEEDLFSTRTFAGNFVKSGPNIIAVEVHQSAANSSDVSFDLGMSLEFQSAHAVVDSVTFPFQVADVTYGRDPVNPAMWRQFSEATPGAENSGAAVDDLRKISGKVSPSLAGGFYSSSQVVALSSSAGVIHYTLDGSLPRSVSPTYSTPLSITKTEVLRARVIEAGKLPGPVETRTYFIGETPGTVPIISFVADPTTLFGDRIGIYYNQHEPVTIGGTLRDVYKNKEVPCSVEFFEPGGALGFKVKAGATIGAENSWAVAQRPLNIHMRSKFGDDAIHYDLFPGSKLADHTLITFRNGGDSWKTDMLRDALLPFIAEGQLRIDAQGYRPSIVFINGAYFGLHEIRQKYDEGWFAGKYRLLSSEYDHLGYAHVDSTVVKLEAVKGGTNSWLDLLSFMATHDLTVQTNWNRVEAEVDLDSYIDFIVVEAYVMNTSWRHNREFWRAHHSGAKWKWLLPDIDQGFKASNLVRAGELSNLLNEEPILRRAIQNSAFKTRLAQRFAAHLASTFSTTRIDAIIDALDLEARHEVPRHEKRWGGDGGMTVTGRADSLKSVKTFVAQRPATMIEELRRALNLLGTQPLTLTLSEPRGGRVLIEGVPVFPGVIQLFDRLPADLLAEPAPGYVFAGWEDGTAGPERRVTLTAPLEVRAHFVRTIEHLLPDRIESTVVLSATDAAYVLTSDLVIAPNAQLIVGAGVELRIPSGAHLRVQGMLRVNGTAAKPVIFTGRGPDYWGGISFEHTTGPSVLNHLQIHHASHGWDPSRFPAALSAFESDLEMNFIEIMDSAFPVFTRGGSTVLRDSRLHTPFSGDCINVKGGFGEVSRCKFFGNEAPDTDAIDFDSVVNGVIRDNFIYGFRGSNSDGVDLGEQASNVLVEGNRIYFNSDKGISVGQASTAVIRHNLIVGCPLGVAVKDTGSFASIDQNTFVGAQTGVAVYEKNFADGGGSAEVSNSIFSHSLIAPISVDAYSQLTVSYSLSDGFPLQGKGNVVADPRFLDPALLNFQLAVNSPAWDSGDPAHAADADGTRADMGAGYRYQAEDYPFTRQATVVINEVLANSGSGSDWIELHNRTTQPMAIGGWFLSDSAENLKKYRLPADAVIPGGGFVLLDESQHFGAASKDPGRLQSFALRDIGETLYLTAAKEGEFTGYQSKESFGPSFPGRSLGTFYKSTSDSFNFVELLNPTPGTTNSAPHVGPLVFSEIMYHPLANHGPEFVELMNITRDRVALHDPEKQSGWRITGGFTFSFPTNAVIAPGERIVLTQSRALLTAEYAIPKGTQIFEWTDGRLDNAGEILQIGAPGPTNDLGVVQFVRVDRVNYSPEAPWPTAAAGAGMSLSRITPSQYGNTASNWIAHSPSPGVTDGLTNYAEWVARSGLPADQSGLTDDPDKDRIPNLLEFVLGGNPLSPEAASPLNLVAESSTVWIIEYSSRTDFSGVALDLEFAENVTGPWQPLSTVVAAQSASMARNQARFENKTGPQAFFRLMASPR